MYDALAAYYDRFMSDVDYDAWINYLKDIWASACAEGT